jgi:hypothetical protein
MVKDKASKTGIRHPSPADKQPAMSKKTAQAARPDTGSTKKGDKRSQPTPMIRHP